MEKFKFKVNDVFSFRYNEEETKKRFEPYHCFDGTLVAKERNDGSLILEDTYWGGGESRTLTTGQAQKEGTLTFLCNLDEVEKTENYNSVYYDESDFITLSIHAGYRNQHFVKKGAKRSANKMVESVKAKIEQAENTKRFAENDIKRYTETLAKIEAGDTSIYI